MVSGGMDTTYSLPVWEDRLGRGRGGGCKKKKTKKRKKKKPRFETSGPKAEEDLFADRKIKQDLSKGRGKGACDSQQKGTRKRPFRWTGAWI